MRPDQEKYILENYRKKPIKEIAAQLQIKERKIKDFLERQAHRKNVLDKSATKSEPVARRLIYWHLIVIALFGFLAYANTLDGQFLWDDESLVQRNPYIKDWAYLPRLITSGITAGEGEATNFYRPVQMVSYLIDYSLWKTNVFGYHLINILWHLLTALAVYFLVRRLFEKDLLALLTALFFVLHPIHTEAVAYISGRADSLAAFFMLATLILYLKNLERDSVLRLAGMGALFLLALLSRENALILPLLVLFYHVSFKKQAKWKPSLVGLAVFTAYIFWRIGLLQGQLTANANQPDFFERLPGFFVAFANYLRLLFLPVNLHMEYGGLIFNFGDPAVWAGVTLFILIISYALRMRQKDTLAFFSINWFFLTLLPASNIFYPINAYMAEHWLYLPSIGFFLLLSRWLSELIDNKSLKLIGILLTAVLLTLCLLMTAKQNHYWRKPTDLYKRMVDLAPHSSKLYNNLAKAYHDAGKEEELVGLLKHALEIEPENAKAYNNLGNALKGLKKYDEAIAAYEQAIKFEPKVAGAYYNLALVYADQRKDTDKALTLLNQALKVNPFFAEAYHKLGLIYMNQGRKDEAISLLQQALKINPDRAEVYHSMGYFYVQAGKMPEAQKMYETAVEINPSYGEAHHDLAVLHLSAGHYDKAIRYCDRAVALGNRDEALLEVLKNYRS